MKCNIGKTDRSLRMLVGLALIAYGLATGSLLGLAACLPAVSWALVGWALLAVLLLHGCPLQPLMAALLLPTQQPCGHGQRSRPPSLRSLRALGIPHPRPYIKVVRNAFVARARRAGYAVVPDISIPAEYVHGCGGVPSS